MQGAGDLQTFLSECLCKLSAPQRDCLAKYILTDVASSMCYLHSIGIHHGDYKPANVCLQTGSSDGARKFTCKLIDFGFAVRTWGEVVERDAPTGTLGYMAPELHPTARQGQDFLAILRKDPWAHTKIDAPTLEQVQFMYRIGPAQNMPPQSMPGSTGSKKSDVYALGRLIYDVAHPDSSTQLQSRILDKQLACQRAFEALTPETMHYFANRRCCSAFETLSCSELVYASIHGCFVLSLFIQMLANLALRTASSCLPQCSVVNS